MDPTIVVMLMACGLGFFALLVAMKEEHAVRQQIAVDENPYIIADAGEA